MSEESKEIEKAEADNTQQKFLARIFGPVADEAGQHLALEFQAVTARRRANLRTIVARAQEMQEDAGIPEPQPLPLNVSVPMLEAASLAEDETLQGKWAALLANATSGQEMLYSVARFADLPSQLSPLQVRVLDALWDEWQQSLRALSITQEQAMELHNDFVRLQIWDGPTTQTHPACVEDFHMDMSVRYGLISQFNSFGQSFMCACRLQAPLHALDADVLPPTS